MCAKPIAAALQHSQAEFRGELCRMHHQMSASVKQRLDHVKPFGVDSLQ